MALTKKKSLGSKDEETKAAPAKKVRKKSSKKAEIVYSGEMPVRSLKVYRKNPRIGDIDSIAQSLDKNGQYRSIVVNRGTHAAVKNEVLAGNHTFMAARKLGWESILVNVVDVDDDRARAIVLADNKTAENGTYDEKLIGELLAEVPDIASTGFRPEEADDLIAQATSAAQDVLSDLNSSGALDINLGDSDAEEDASEDAGSLSFYNDSAPDDDDYGPDADDSFIPEAEPESQASEDITSKPSEVEGVSQLSFDLPEDPKYWNGYLQLPKLRSDMFMKPEEWPENIETWAGSATRDNQPDDQWWHYPWGGDSTKGLKNLDQVIVSFYSWDQDFDNWFWAPNKYAAKLINSGIKYVITPDWSMWTNQSKFMNLFSLYRNLYVTRYLQEVGIKTVQNLGFPNGDDDFMDNFLFKYIPKNQKVFARQGMSWSRKMFSEEGIDEGDYIRQYRKLFDHFEPEMMIFYGNKGGSEWFRDTFQPLYPNMKIVFLKSRLDLISDWKTANGVTSKRKKTI